MRHHAFVLLVILLFCLLAARAAFAQTTAVTYYGYLTVQGAPAHGEYAFHFRLYSAGGDLLGVTQVKHDVVVNHGHFVVVLTYADTAGIITGEQQWVEVAVGDGAGHFAPLAPWQCLQALRDGENLAATQASSTYFRLTGVACCQHYALNVPQVTAVYARMNSLLLPPRVVLHPETVVAHPVVTIKPHPRVNITSVKALPDAQLNLSDWHAKENFTPVTARDLLKKLTNLPISTWSYKSQSPTVRHIGPMAQDFYKVFGVGEDDKFINTVDADGVALATIQGLYQLLHEKGLHIAELERQVKSQQRQLDSLAERVDTLEGAQRTPSRLPATRKPSVSNTPDAGWDRRSNNSNPVYYRGGLM